MNVISPEQTERHAFFQRFETLLAFSVFLCLAAYALGANPFSGQTVAPFDRMLQFAGWFSVPSDRQAVNAERSDILDSQLPTWITLKDQIRKGESPLWYPNGAGGQPISLELCNPGFLIFLAVKDNALAYYLVSLFKLIISGFGVYLLLRIYLQWLPAVWGGIVFMLCGFNAAWFFWEQVTTAMWIPWLLWATIKYLKLNDPKWLPAVSLTSLMLIFGAFPAVAGFGFYSFALLILVWDIHDLFYNKQIAKWKRADTVKFLLKRTALPLLAVGIAFLMSAVALVPFINFMSGINLGYRSGGAMPLSINDLLLFFSYEDPPRVERTAYVGIIACILALIGIFRMFGKGSKTLRLFILFNVLLVVLSILIAFGLLPHKLIGAIPIFNNNPKWGRLTVITLLGLAALSAVGLEFGAAKIQSISGSLLRLKPLHAQRLITVLMVVIIAVQFHSQKKLFNNFNAVVPSEWFYPVTPSIKYVKEHLRPLQSVIADLSYWFAGTLGAYGIPEWYAHSFRTDREKEVLSELVHDPFSSATSGFITSPNIQFNSPLMDKLAIKYLLVRNEPLWSKKTYELPALSHDLAPPLPFNSWRQHIYIPVDSVVDSIGFLFSTYGSEYAPANVRLSIYNEMGRKLSLEPEIDKNNISDNSWGFFRFPNNIFFRKGSYSFVLSLHDYTGPSKLSVWATKVSNAGAGSLLEINGAMTDYSLKWRIGYYQRLDPSELNGRGNMFNLEKDILIFENKRVTNSAYFVKSLDAPDGQIDFSGLDITDASSDFLKINYLKGEAGWIVLPMHLNSDWKAYVNGQQVQYASYINILPAIPVQGKCDVTFKYEPSSFRRGVMLSLAGFIIFAIFSWGCFKKRSPGISD